MPTMVSLESVNPDENTTPPKYADISLNDYRKNFLDIYVVCTLHDAAATYKYSTLLEFFMNEKVEVLADDK